MAENKLGKQSIVFKNRPEIISTFSIVGKKEGEGPMHPWFDQLLDDDKCGQKTWEEAETKILKDSVIGAVKSGKIDKHDIDIIFSGDLINQLMTSSYAIRELGIPFLGLYGACSTMSESLIIAAAFVNAGYSKYAAAAASSHFCTAERQFRTPLEHGNQKPPSAQITVTGAGCGIIRERNVSDECACGCGSSKSMEETKDSEADRIKDCCCGVSDRITAPKGVYVTGGTIGKIVDMGISDTYMMGAAMAPAAINTLTAHFNDTGREPEYYDMIFTGDLGKIGKDIVIDSMMKKGFDLSGNYEDCGCMIFDDTQDSHSGGSGCGCSGTIFAGYIHKELRSGKFKRVLFMSTGALLSTISTQQGESIPGIAHAVSLSSEEEDE